MMLSDHLANAFINVLVLAGLLMGVSINHFFPESSPKLILLAIGVLIGRIIWFGIRFWWEELRD